MYRAHAKRIWHAFDISVVGEYEGHIHNHSRTRRMLMLPKMHQDAPTPLIWQGDITTQPMVLFLRAGEWEPKVQV